MGKLFELTGLPASGKSTYIRKNNLSVVTIDLLFPKFSNLPQFLSKILSELLLFFVGIFQMSFKEIYFYFHISMNEKVGPIHKMNIFRNTARKFGVFFLCRKLSVEQDLYIDEGLSHIPFNFLSTDFSILETRLAPYLNKIQVKLIECPERAVIMGRLMLRGHARLNFYTERHFIRANLSVEKKLLIKYPSLCYSFEIIKQLND